MWARKSTINGCTKICLIFKKYNTFLSYFISYIPCFPTAVHLNLLSVRLQPRLWQVDALLYLLGAGLLSDKVSILKKMLIIWKVLPSSLKLFDIIYERKLVLHNALHWSYHCKKGRGGINVLYFPISHGIMLSTELKG